MITIKCLACGEEQTSYTIETKCCGCSNMTTIKGNIISAVDMAKVVMLNTYNPADIDNSLSPSELEWQEKRNKRKVRKLDFEDRSFR